MLSSANDFWFFLISFIGDRLVLDEIVSGNDFSYQRYICFKRRPEHSTWNFNTIGILLDIKLNVLHGSLGNIDAQDSAKWTDTA